MKKDVVYFELSFESFLELLVEIAALQRLRAEWQLQDDDQEGLEEKREILERVLAKKLDMRAQALGQLRETFPDMANFSWGSPDAYDA